MIGEELTVPERGQEKQDSLPYLRHRDEYVVVVGLDWHGDLDGPALVPNTSLDKKVRPHQHPDSKIKGIISSEYSHCPCKVSWSSLFHSLAMTCKKKVNVSETEL